MSGHVLALAGGVGGAKLALGLARVLPPEDLTIVVNTGDDETFHSLHVSPDLDTVMYTLAGIANPETGWGIQGETFRLLEGLEHYGAPTWFKLGDQDLATHIRRTHLLAEGWTLSEVTAELAKRLGIEHAIVPMSDQPVRTRLLTDEGELAFQEYFVRERSTPVVRSIWFQGAERAKPAPAFERALLDASILIICPSNPLVSVAPILAVPGVREAISQFRGPRLAVSPIVGGKALKGPAAKMMAELGEDVTSLGVAERYGGLCDTLVIDHQDEALAPPLRERGMDAIVTNAVMETEEDKVRLAREVLRASAEASIGSR